MGKLKIKARMIIMLAGIAGIMVFQYIMAVGSMNRILNAAETAEQAVKDTSLDAFFMTSVIALVIVIVYGILLTIDLVRSIDAASAYAISIADGDLTQTVKGKYLSRKDSVGDLSRSLEKIHDNMNNIIGNINEESKNLLTVVKNTEEHMEQIAGDLDGISAETQDLAAGMEETAAASEQMNAVSAEIETIAKNIAIHAQDGAVRVSEIHERASKAKKDTTESREKTKQVSREIRESLDQAIKNAEVVKNIEVLANTILGITTQTNLLALNASIEAARAGEAGKGFAVVADEIRNLADQSKDAVAHIQEVTEGVTGAVEKLSDDSRRLLEFISTDVAGNFDTFSEVTEFYNQDAVYVDDLVSDFSATSQELLASIDGILEAISNVSEASTTGAQSTTEIADKALTVNDKSKELESEVKKAETTAEKLMADVKKIKIA